MSDRTPVVAVLGVTASGKSHLALEIAAQFSGELICADSRTVHRGLDIGAAKPSRADQARTPHHLLDVVDLDDLITGPQFGEASDSVVETIAARGGLPIIVGGTRLFVTTALHSTVTGPSASDAWISDMPLDDVHARFQATGISLPLAWKNRSTLAAVWRNNQLTEVGTLKRPTLRLVTANAGRTRLEARIADRVDAMLAAGLEQEVRELCIQHGCTAGDLNSIGYAEWAPYFTGDADGTEVRSAIITNTVAYAAGQQRWLANLSHLHVVRSTDDAFKEVANFLDQQHHPTAPHRDTKTPGRR